jgi:capsular polysaccharide biosynthesis protein
VSDKQAAIFRASAFLLRLNSLGYRKLVMLLTYALSPVMGRLEATRLRARMATEAGDYAAAERYCRQVVCMAPDDEAALNVLGRILLSGSRTDEALGLFERHDRLVGGPDVVTLKLDHRHLDLVKATQGKLYFTRLKDVSVDTVYWSIMTDDGVVYSADTHGRNIAKSPFVSGRVSGNGKSIIVSFAKPSVEIKEECVFVGGDDNYSHWVFRNLLKLSVLDDAHLLFGSPWLLNRDLTPYQVEYLALLGIDPARQILVDRQQVIRCRQLLVPALLTSPKTIAVGIAWLNRRLDHVRTPRGQARELIYVSREDAPKRQVVNEQDLLDELSPLGFRKIVPGRMTVKEQIREFSAARVIVAVHGAGLTNLVFAHSHAAIIEIVSSTLSDMDDFRRIARAAGQQMTTIVSDTYVNAGAPHVNSDFAVDIQQVKCAVLEALGAA